MRLRSLLWVNPTKSAATHLPPETDVTFAPMEAIADGVGGLDTSTTKTLAEVGSGSYSYFADGDILLAKVTPCFENGKKAIAHGLANGIGFATSEVHVIRPDTRRIDRAYLVYLFCSAEFRAAGMASMTGAGGLKRVSEDAIRNFGLPVSDLKSQKAIADFLDRETTRIDQLIEKKHSQLSMLGSKKLSQTAELVTRGLDLGVTMAPTGIEWLPQAPSHWRVRRIATLFREMDEHGDEGLPVLSVSINWGISDRQLEDEDRHRVVNHIADKTAYKRIRPGDLVYNMMRAWQGAFGVTAVDGLVSPAYVVARPKEAIHSPYFEPLLRTPMCIEEFRRASKGIADFRQRLYWKHFRQVRVALPPFHEQQAIAERIRESAAAIDRVIAPVTNSIKHLQELRSALITAAVTGQIDVAIWGKRGAADRRLEAIEAEEIAVAPRPARRAVPA